MPFFLLIVGGILVVAGARNTQGDLLTLVEGDFTGSDNFVYWFLSILAIGSLGYIKPIRPVANSFLALVIVVLLLHNGGFFAKWSQQIGALSSTRPAPIKNTYNAGSVTSAATPSSPPATQSWWQQVLGAVVKVAAA